MVVASGAESFVVSHGHPSGKCTPSSADRKLTELIRQAFKPLEADVTFMDHCVIGVGEYYSFADNKTYKVKRGK